MNNKSKGTFFWLKFKIDNLNSSTFLKGKNQYQNRGSFRFILFKYEDNDEAKKLRTSFQ